VLKGYVRNLVVYDSLEEWEKDRREYKEFLKRAVSMKGKPFGERLPPEVPKRIVITSDGEVHKFLTLEEALTYQDAHQNAVLTYKDKYFPESVKDTKYNIKGVKDENRQRTKNED